MFGRVPANSMEAAVRIVAEYMASGMSIRMGTVADALGGCQALCL